MKKGIIALSLFSLVLGTMSAHAYYYSKETSSVDVLESQGYSKNTLITVDKANKFNGGLYSDYKSVYKKKTPKNKYSNAYTVLKNYVDPNQDDGKFFEHEINFTNSWNQDAPSYAYPVERVNKVENL